MSFSVKVFGVIAVGLVLSSSPLHAQSTGMCAGSRMSTTSQTRQPNNSRTSNQALLQQRQLQTTLAQQQLIASQQPQFSTLQLQQAATVQNQQAALQLQQLVSYQQQLLLLQNQASLTGNLFTPAQVQQLLLLQQQIAALQQRALNGGLGQ